MSLQHKTWGAGVTARACMGRARMVGVFIFDVDVEVARAAVDIHNDRNRYINMIDIIYICIYILRIDIYIPRHVYVCIRMCVYVCVYVRVCLYNHIDIYMKI